jgi:hypothetical protein
MKAGLVAVCVSGFNVPACTNASRANPGSEACAAMPGGVIAVQPRTLDVVSYDPGAQLNASAETSITAMSCDGQDPTGLSTLALDENPNAISESR